MTTSTTRFNTAKSLFAAAATAAALFTALPAQAGGTVHGLAQAGNSNIVNIHSRQGRPGRGNQSYSQYRGGYTMMSPREIRYSLRNQGLRGISDIYYRPNRELYVATGWSGVRLLKVGVNPYSGQIVRSRVLRVANRGYGGSGPHGGNGLYYRQAPHNGFSIQGPNGSFRFRW